MKCWTVKKTYIAGPPFQINNIAINFLTKTTTPMASESNICWEAPKFTFYAPNQEDEWKAFYIQSASLKLWTLTQKVKTIPKRMGTSMHVVWGRRLISHTDPH